MPAGIVAPRTLKRTDEYGNLIPEWDSIQGAAPIAESPTTPTGIAPTFSDWVSPNPNPTLPDGTPVLPGTKWDKEGNPLPAGTPTGLVIPPSPTPYSGSNPMPGMSKEWVDFSYDANGWETLDSVRARRLGFKNEQDPGYQAWLKSGMPMPEKLYPAERRRVNTVTMGDINQWYAKQKDVQNPYAGQGAPDTSWMDDWGDPRFGIPGTGRYLPGTDAYAAKQAQEQASQKALWLEFYKNHPDRIPDALSMNSQGVALPGGLTPADLSAMQAGIGTVNQPNAPLFGEGISGDSAAAPTYTPPTPQAAFSAAAGQDPFSSTPAPQSAAAENWQPGTGPSWVNGKWMGPEPGTAGIPDWWDYSKFGSYLDQLNQLYPEGKNVGGQSLLHPGGSRWFDETTGKYRMPTDFQSRFQASQPKTSGGTAPSVNLSPSNQAPTFNPPAISDRSNPNFGLAPLYNDAAKPNPSPAEKSTSLPTFSPQALPGEPMPGGVKTSGDIGHEIKRQLRGYNLGVNAPTRFTI